MGRRLYLDIHHDSDVESPCENDGFKLYSFIRDHRSHRDPEKLPFSKRALKRMFDRQAAWLLDYYEHSLCSWSLAGAGHQCQWDTSRCAGILVWAQPLADLNRDPAARTKQAESFLEVYTDWCNGNCYWYRLEDENEEDVDTCGGYYGDDHLIDGLNETLEPDDVVVLRKGKELIYATSKLKCQLVDYLPDLPEPEYFI